MAALLSPLLGAWLVSVASANIAFAFDALTFAAAAVCVLPAGWLSSPSAAVPGRTANGVACKAYSAVAVLCG